MISRLWGAVLLMAAGALLGMERVRRTREKLLLLEEWEQALCQLGDDISQRGMSLSECFQERGKLGGKLADLFEKLAAKLGEEPLFCAWKGQILTQKLDKRETRLLESLGAVLGVYEADSQRAHLYAVSRELGERRRALSEQGRREARMLPGVGGCLGAMLAVLLL